MLLIGSSESYEAPKSAGTIRESEELAMRGDTDYLERKLPDPARNELIDHCAQPKGTYRIGPLDGMPMQMPKWK